MFYPLLVDLGWVSIAQINFLWFVWVPDFSIYPAERIFSIFFSLDLLRSIPYFSALESPTSAIRKPTHSKILKILSVGLVCPQLLKNHYYFAPVWSSFSFSYLFLLKSFTWKSWERSSASFLIRSSIWVWSPFDTKIRQVSNHVFFIILCQD